MLYYANTDKTKLVEEGSPEAAYTISDADPGEFAELLKAKAEADEEAEKARAAKGDNPPAAEPDADAKPVSPVATTNAQAAGVASSRSVVAEDPSSENRPAGRSRRGG
jgi:hypothetical protein